MPPKKRPSSGGPAGNAASIQLEGGQRRGFTSSRHGVKKQKLSAQSAELRAETKRAREIQSLVRAKEEKLSKKKTVAREGRARIPYNKDMQYLLVGEGNFSFTHALVKHFVEQREKAQQQATGGAEQTVAASAASAAPAQGKDDSDDDAPSAAAADGAAGGKKKFYRKKDGQFDAATHRPLLPPNTLFTNRDIRVVATCYDSWKELLFKYPDVTTHLSYLTQQRIPVFTGVDALHLDQAKRAGRTVTPQAIKEARKEERENKGARDQARQERRKREEEADEAGMEDVAREDSESEPEEEDDEEAEESTAERTALDDEAAQFNTSSSTASLLTAKPTPLLFPNFITRRAFHQAQSEAEQRLHGSQRKKLKDRRAAELEEFKQASTAAAEGATASAAAAAGASTSATPASKSSSSSSAAVSKPQSLKSLLRAQNIASSLQALNSTPRTRFHRILFLFPHTGCGIKDTERNNEIHRHFLEQFMRHIVATRILLPETKHGELHITLKRGEPYTSWNIVSLARRVAGLKFKTSFEFLPQLYKGYEHRRTRGWDGEKTGEINVATGSVQSVNDIITGTAGSMTYVFTRESNVMDEEEDRSDAKWSESFSKENEEETTRRHLLQECERIYRETKARQAGATGVAAAASATGVAQSEAHADDDEDEQEQAEDDADMLDGDEHEEEDDEAAQDDQDEDDDHDDSPSASAAAASASIAVPNLAAQLRMHFQPRASLAQKLAHSKQAKLKTAAASSAGAGAGKKQNGKRKRQ